jgi:hypothetical protein
MIPIWKSMLKIMKDYAKKDEKFELALTRDPDATLAYRDLWGAWYALKSPFKLQNSIQHIQDA